MAKNTSKLKTAGCFVAGMGTILSVSPVVGVERTNRSGIASERLANATVRVGTYFDRIRTRVERSPYGQKQKG